MTSSAAVHAAAGRLFIGSTTAAGTTLPVLNGTAQTFGLWNPVGSNKLAVLMCMHVGATSTNQGVHADALGCSVLHNTGAQVAAGGPITAFTVTASANALLGSGQESAMRFTLSATIAAPTFLRSFGMGHNQTTVYLGSHNFDGDVIVPPGVYLGFGKSESDAETYQMTLMWAELDL